MKTASPVSVLETLNIQQATGTLAVAGLALDSTFPILEELLETALLSGEQVDYYHLPKIVSHPKLRLTNSMLKGTPVVMRHTLYSTADGVALNADEYTVDPVKGVVTLVGVRVGGFTFSVQYLYGYDESSETPGLLADVPAFISSAHISLAAAYQQLNPAAVQKDKAKALGAMSVNGYYVAAKMGLAGAQRPRGLCKLPDYTVAVV